MSNFPRVVLATIGLFLLVVMTGCGGKSGPSPEESAAVSKAITTYLAEQAMEMKVAEVTAFTPDGDNATAAASLQQADGVYNVKVSWNFILKKAGDGWKVESHTEAK